MSLTEFTPAALRDRAATDLHTILREVALLPFMTDRPDAELIADRVAAGEPLLISVDALERSYRITQGASFLQAGALAANDASLELLEAAGALLVAAVNSEPAELRAQVADQLDDTGITVELRIGQAAEAVTIAVGHPPAFTATVTFEAAPDEWLMPPADSLH